jgi:diguanylate cyclase (GGDEF)-like protein/PAS domain S-box-containing protein
MSCYAFEQLVDIAQVQTLLESHNRLSGMTYTLLDPAENCLVAIGWQDICVRFHRDNPVSCVRCRESDAYIKEHLRDFDGDFIEYRCKNGMIDVAMPILIEGRHLATFFTGQFFYEDSRLEPGFFIKQAEDLGFDRDAYLDALQRVPVFSREYVRDNMIFLRNLVKVLSKCGLNNLKRNREMEERKRAEELLHRREQEFRAMIENSPDPVIRYDRAGRRIYVNPAFERVMGNPSRLLLGKTPSEMPAGGHIRSGNQVEQAINHVLREGVPAEEEVTWKDDNGLDHCFQVRFVPEFDPNGLVTTVLSTARDISPLRKYQQQLHHLAYYEPLTGLPNRALFLERLRQAVAEVSLCGQKKLALMLLDLDRFKTVNESLGHGIGNELLFRVGQRLEQEMRSHGPVAHLGGDEFAIILPDVFQGTDIGAIARKVLAIIAEPFDIQGRQLFVTASLGIASCPKDSRKVSELMQLADAAMHHAKTRGRNHFQFCSSELKACAKERLSLETALRKALKQKELELYYQPKIVLETGKLAGAEALLRWHHPEWGIITPDRFIGIAEDTGLIIELGEWVLREACRTACEWNRVGNVRLKVAINLSARQFDKKNLVETIRMILADTACRPEWVEMEITESLLLEERSDILTALKELWAMGFTIAIDDFGTGYSALGYLTKFPIQTLKIDKSFIRDLTNNRHTAELIKAIVSLGHALRMDLVAEGVETWDQGSLLKSIGCHFAQGYLYGKPVPRKQFEEMMGTGTMNGSSGYWPVLQQ